ncbi:class I SAM-dependent methyltransferase [Actinocrinis puniceicyclus]|uniref:Class I SAM-dependent methyltransferase n=1 Tax=Actinocrinis puniceicyclus TaxID=977794 RepID=A0A8J7WL45_9ACTN|nr:class I SAM-dependent methyltransferase [Actinocrinis puniceicyclus]MBS2961504.1 class I SAM-dependent methyltransferase [Actinocrinis puniceicyclus]
MTTMTPEPSPPAGNEPHRAREIAQSFGADADRYDRARPGYPDALIKRIVSACPGRDVVDVGCGTGIAARQFHAAGCRVLGVEVDARMADLARRTGTEVEVSTFEEWDPAGRRFDAVVAAQAWHWVDPVAGAGRAAEALREGGRLAAFWNVFQLPPDLARAFAETYRRVLPETEFFQRAVPGLEVYAPIFTKAAAGIEQTGAFDEPERWNFAWQRSYTRDEWLDQVPTFGGHSRFPAQTQRDLLAGLGAAIDSVGGSFLMQYATVAVTAARKTVS